MFVRPEQLKAPAGRSRRGLASARVVVAWVPGNPSLDQILSVGVAKMVEATNHPISSKIYRHDGDEWVVWGEAKLPSRPRRSV